MRKQKEGKIISDRVGGGCKGRTGETTRIREKKQSVVVDLLDLF